MERIKELSILVSLATLRACYRVSRGGCIDRRWIVSPLCVCTLNAIPSFIPTADRTEGGDGKDIFSQSVSWSGMMEFFSFFPLKRTMIFVLFRVENSKAPCPRLPAIDQQNLSDDHPTLEVCRSVWKSRWEHAVDLRSERLMEKRNCRFIEDGVFYLLYFRHISLFESFIPLFLRFDVRTRRGATEF